MAIPVGNDVTLEINGKRVFTSGVSIDPGVDIEMSQWDNSLYATPVVTSVSPSIFAGDVKLGSINLHGVNSVKVLFEPVVRWVFPDDRFVTYEPGDEGWCRFFGIGEEKAVQRVLEMPVAYIAGGDYSGVRFVGACKEGEVIAQ
jgi:hypothetical protein